MASRSQSAGAPSKGISTFCSIHNSLKRATVSEGAYQQASCATEPPVFSVAATKRKHDDYNHPLGIPPVKKRKQSLTKDNDFNSNIHIEHWLQHWLWPKELFEPYPMAHLLARKKSSASLGRKRSVGGSTIAGTDGQTNREEKSAPYMNPLYEEQLQTKGFYMQDDSLGPNVQSTTTYNDLLGMTPTLPKDTRFADHLFTTTCENVHNKNETRVIRDIAELIVPSAEDLSARGEIAIKGLIESVNEGWTLTDPITPVRPQPDFSVGYRRFAFTEQQLSKIRPILGDSLTQVSRFRATWYMYFPFLSCEVKCGTAALDIADRQNAHSMGIAVRAVVNLFQLARREQEVNREILAFSISHDDRDVRIYGYYPIIQANQVSYHRHLINDIKIQAAAGREKWTSYRFVKSVYQTWAPRHLQRILSILDELPEDITGLVTQSTQSSGPSQQIDSSDISRTEEQRLSEPLEGGVQSQVRPLPPLTPDASISAVKTSTKNNKASDEIR